MSRVRVYACFSVGVLQRHCTIQRIFPGPSRILDQWSLAVEINREQSREGDPVDREGKENENLMPGIIVYKMLRCATREVSTFALYSTIMYHDCMRREDIYWLTCQLEGFRPEVAGAQSQFLLYRFFFYWHVNTPLRMQWYAHL